MTLKSELETIITDSNQLEKVYIAVINHRGKNIHRLLLLSFSCVIMYQYIFSPLLIGSGLIAAPLLPQIPESCINGLSWLLGINITINNLKGV